MNIAILVHAADSFHRRRYFLRRIAEQWAALGHRVVVADDPATPPEADLAVLHVDLTRVPEEFRRMADIYPTCLNGRVLDISKRSFSRQLVDRGGPWDGPVIVKTDANDGGAPESRLPHRRRPVARLGRAFRRALPLSLFGEPGRGDYPVFDRPADVPRAVWRHRRLVVERFLPERTSAGEYVLRIWLFLGDAEATFLVYGNRPIVKSRGIRYEIGGEVPDELRAIRRRLGFDYGKFDWGRVDGRPVLYDVNRTPSGGVDERALPIAARLARGVPALRAD